MRTGFARLKIAFAVATVLLFPGHLAIAAPLKEAQVTQIIKDVQLLPNQAAPRPAAIRDNVGQGSSVKTGTESRSELTFSDQTLVRLGANTLFSLNEGTRTVDLGGGAMLLSVPKDSPSATVRTAAVTAAVTGGTALLEHHQQAPAKYICLEGLIRVFLKASGELVIVRPGQMLVVPPGATHLSDPVYVDLKLIVATCPLLTEFPPLANEPLIAQEVQKQEEQKENGTLVASTPPGTNPDPQYIDPIDQAINALGPLGGILIFNEIGPLNTITTPDPYVINNTTSFVTAPTITTNGVTDGGKFYRGMALDGLPGDYMFGASNAFDSNSGFNEQLVQAANLPVAVFKFNNLQITGNPTINIPPGGATKLALIGIGGLTSGPPGATLTFTGLDTLILLTQNGSINLTPDVSFSGLPLLWLHARGNAAADITIASTVTGVGAIRHEAEGSVQINADETVGGFSVFAGADFLDGTGHVTTQNISIMAGDNITFTSGDFAVGPGTNPSVFLQAGSNLTIDLTGDQTAFTTASSIFAQGGVISLAGTSVTFPSATSVQFIVNTGAFNAVTMDIVHPGNLLSINAATDITANSIIGGDFIQAGGNITTNTGSLTANGISAAGNIQSAANITGINSVFAGGTISNPTGTLMSPSVTAIGNITTNHVVVQNINQGVSPSNTILTAGGGGITPFVGSSGSALQHTFTVNRIVSPQGIDFSGAQFGFGSNGGLLTINAQTQTIGAAGIASVNFNGADGDPAGSGGTFTLNTVGDLTVGANIDATTGIIPTNGTPSGNGGTVNLTSSTGVITVNSRIRTSSADPAGTVNRRSSATGGRINISSGGTQIVVANTSQLLALLENASPGSNGLITIAATGNNSGVQVLGQVQADHGEIDIRNTGSVGTVTVTGANANLHADVIKVAALGPGGTLTIGGNSVISADSVLKLYANASNGQIIFASNCTIGGGSMNIIAANTVTINGAATVVTVTGAMADVYTNVPNYTGSGGNNMAGTGTFGGAGATTHLGMAPPPLGGPGMGP